MNVILGFILVIFAGLGTGSAAWPFKVIRDIHLAQYLFISMLLSIGIFPWLLVLINVPEPAEVIRAVGPKTLLISNLLTIAWGVANVLYFMCVIQIGAALTGVILSALGMSVGIIMPLVFKGSGLFSNAPDLLSKPGLLILTGLFLVIIGLTFVSIAGFGREKALRLKDEQTRKIQASGNFLQGLLLVVLAGVLSSGLGLSFVYGQGPIIEAVKLQGVGEITANITVWALVCIGGTLVNVGYAAYLMSKQKSWRLLFSRKGEILCGALFGIQFLLSIVFLGRGMVLLGILGASIGYGIQQSMQVIGGQVVGFAGGEWKGVGGKPRKIMFVALGFIFAAIVVMAYSNRFS
jgi:L-rhamnose-H+ transport protein